jgi:hypothetical protein
MARRPMIALALAALVCCPAALAAGSVSGPATGLQDGVIFTEMTPLSRNTELERRLWSPLKAAQLERNRAGAGQTLSAQPLALFSERFVVYVPPVRPAGGYGVLVYIPAGKDTRLPPGWQPVLNQLGVIFVSAAGSGNDENVYGRRIPLALNAATNIVRLYNVDPQRVYIGGTSGGSRVAMRAALAYPDLFHGAMLNAGSDEIDNDYIPLPPGDLMNQFQASSRLVYLTGDEDNFNLNKDAASRGTMRDWCQFNLDTETLLRTGPGTTAGRGLSRALKLLATPLSPDAEKLSACRAQIEKDLAGQMAEVEALKAAGKNADARALLDKIDRRFGGLAGPHSLELDAALTLTR